MALNGRIFDAEVIMISDDYDLAVVKVDRTDLPYFRMSTGKVDRLTDVSAIGFPGAANVPFSEYGAIEKMARAASSKDIKRFFAPSDLDYTQTRGFVSRVFDETAPNPAGKTAWIQHTASISPGNSGGPLCLIDGAVVGINSVISTRDANMKFSFSVNQIRDEVEAATGKLHWR